MIKPPMRTGLFGKSAMGILRTTGRMAVTIAVVFYSLLDALIFPLVRPLVGWLSGLHLFRVVGAAIAGLPPYIVLALLGLSFIVVEPFKALALWWVASGHPWTGLGLLGTAHLMSLFVVERIYHAGHAPLMRIGWFKRLMGWLVGLRDQALGWATSSPAWRAGRAMARRVKAALILALGRGVSGKR